MSEDICFRLRFRAFVLRHICIIKLTAFCLMTIMCIALSGPDTSAQDLKPIYDARLSPKPAKISATEEKLMQAKVLPVAKKIWSGKGCKPDLKPIDTASGSFTKSGSRQKAILYRYCSYGHNLSRNGLVVIEDDHVAAHIMYEGGGENAIGALPDINGNGLSEILISSGGTNQGETWGSVSIIELSESTVKKLGRTDVLSDTCGADEETGKSTAANLSVKPGAAPVFYRETFLQKDCDDAKWREAGGQKPVTLEKDDINYRYIK
jgi:hypothetical protein